MNVWLVDPYCSIPSEGWRASRYTMIAEALVKEGHCVTWWAASFSHQFKRFRSSDWSRISVSPGFCIQLVPTPAYAKHISLTRLRFEIIFALRLYRHATKAPPPDCIITREPSQIASGAAVRLAKRFKVPLVIDVFDLWPEFFTLTLPHWGRFLAPGLFSPLYRLRRHSLRQADAVVAVCNTYLDMAYREAPELRLCPSAVVFIGADILALRRMSKSASEIQILATHISKAIGDVWAIYAGTLGNQYDIDTILRAANQLKSQAPKIKILIAGDGPARQHVSGSIMEHQLTNVAYLGVLSPEDLWAYYQLCDIGLCPYKEGSTVAMPTKVYDYLAAGLPIVNSLEGEMAQFVRDQQVGLQYVSGDAQSLADALKKLTDETNLRHLLAQNSWEAAMQFDREIQYTKLLDVVDRVSGLRKGKTRQ